VSTALPQEGHWLFLTGWGLEAQICPLRFSGGGSEGQICPFNTLWTGSLNI
jgi:hypothetical protein